MLCQNGVASILNPAIFLGSTLEADRGLRVRIARQNQTRYKRSKGPVGKAEARLRDIDKIPYDGKGVRLK